MRTKHPISFQDNAQESEAIFNKIGESYHSVIAETASFKAGSFNDPLRQIKLGCEHEFFLTSKNSEACSFEESQEFLLKLSKLPGWKIFRPVSSSTDFIFRVSKDLNDGNYHSVKYEHPPYLLEVALAPTSSLVEFRERLFDIWEDLLLASQLSRLNLLSSPFISPQKIDWNLVASIDTQYINLKRSRELLVARADTSQPWVNFPTYIAATQFHIGGYRWWSHDSNLLRNLYRTELVVGSKPYERRPQGLSSSKEFFHKRWDGYTKVFNSSPLLGFPKIGEWTINRWIKAFSKSSLILPVDDPNESETLYSIAKSDTTLNLKSLLPKVRDLQIIKPKLIGTLEFRADPALPSPEAITNQAALRFGAFLLCLKDQYEPFPTLNYSEVCDRWWRGMDLRGVEGASEDILDLIWQSLRERNLGEEGLL